MSRYAFARAVQLGGLLLAAVLAFSGFGVVNLYGQGASATILGTVTDMSGATVPDAAVQVRNVGTGTTQSVSTNAQGRFTVPDLGIGDYEVQASKMGFSTVVRKGVNLTVGSQTVVDFALPVGQQSQTVTVETQVSQVEVASASLGTLIGGQQMSNLPINGRNFESLIMLAPGVQTVNTMAPNARQGRANTFSAAGARPEGFVLLMDDEAIENFFRRGMGTITGSSLGMEAMAEFQTLTNTYGAQFGGNGAVMKAVVESAHYRSEITGPNRGRGVALGFWGANSGTHSVNATVNLDGRVILNTGAVDIGGLRAVEAQVMAEVLGIAYEDVTPRYGDTDSIGFSGLTAGSGTGSSASARVCRRSGATRIKGSSRSAWCKRRSAAHDSFTRASSSR